MAVLLWNVHLEEQPLIDVIRVGRSDGRGVAPRSVARLLRRHINAGRLHRGRQRHVSNLQGVVLLAGSGVRVPTPLLRVQTVQVHVGLTKVARLLLVCRVPR